MNGYRLILAVTCSTGMAWRSSSTTPDGVQVAEIYRDGDGDSGDRVLFSVARLRIDPAVLRWFLREADEQL